MNWLESRGRLVQRLKEIQLELRPPKRQNHEMSELKNLRGEFISLLQEYAENVPHIPVSRCPICRETLELAIDLGSIDAPWWWDMCPEPFAEPRACEHFQVFLGAVDFHGLEPGEADVWGVLPGPGMPYVVDRLLSMEGMQAVVNTLRIGPSYSGYLIAYFSAEPVDQAALHQEWRRQTWTLFNEDGEPVAQNIVNDPWDFSLAPWLDNGKLLWIVPEDSSLTLREGRPCPYENIEGVQQKQIIGSGKLTIGAAPDGTRPEYYEKH